MGSGESGENGSVADEDLVWGEMMGGLYLLWALAALAKHLRWENLVLTMPVRQMQGCETSDKEPNLFQPGKCGETSYI